MQNTHRWDKQLATQISAIHEKLHNLSHHKYKMALKKLKMNFYTAGGRAGAILACRVKKQQANSVKSQQQAK